MVLGAFRRWDHGNTTVVQAFEVNCLQTVQGRVWRRGLESAGMEDCGWTTFTPTVCRGRTVFGVDLCGMRKKRRDADIHDRFTNKTSKRSYSYASTWKLWYQCRYLEYGTEIFPFTNSSSHRLDHSYPMAQKLPYRPWVHWISWSAKRTDPRNSHKEKDTGHASSQRVTFAIFFKSLLCFVEKWANFQVCFLSLLGAVAGMYD